MHYLFSFSWFIFTLRREHPISGRLPSAANRRAALTVTRCSAEPGRVPGVPQEWKPLPISTPLLARPSHACLRPLIAIGRSFPPFRLPKPSPPPRPSPNHGDAAYMHIFPSLRNMQEEAKSRLPKIHGHTRSRLARTLPFLRSLLTDLAGADKVPGCTNRTR